MSSRIGIIGAGVSGTSCARVLDELGHQVVLLDRGRLPGGRITSRESRHQPFVWDHGAQYFTARDGEFTREVMRARDAGAAAEWTPRLARLNGAVHSLEEDRRRWVGTPSMGAFGAFLARGLDIRCNVDIERVLRRDEEWMAFARDGEVYGPFDVVVLAVQSGQVERLLPGSTLAKAAADVVFSPCLALLTAWDEPLDLDYDAAFVEGHAIGWIARDSSKPSRARTETWVVHATPVWSREWLDRPEDDWAGELMKSFHELTGVTAEPRAVIPKRWRASIPETVRSHRSLYDTVLGAGVCGDWCGGPRVEGAWLSGRDLASRILDVI